MKAILSIVFCAILLGSCKNEQKPTTPVAKTVDSIPLAPEPQKVYDRPTFIATSTIDSMDTPHTVVSFAYGKTVEVIDKEVTGEFHILEPVEMKQRKLPKSFIVAGSAFWAGLQVTLAVDSTAKGYTIKRQYQDEQGSGKEPFEVVKTYPK